MKEIWNDIIGYEGLYQASSFGRLRSYHGKRVRILKTSFCTSGYESVQLYKNKKRKTCLAHRLVWEAFNGPIPDGMEINHINEDKTDNRLCNLNLMTPKENTNWGTGKQRRMDSYNKRTDEQKAETSFKISKANKGKKWTDEQKAKLNHRKKRVWTDEQKRVASEKNRNGKTSRVVLQYDLDNTFISSYPSMAEVRRQFGFNVGHISDCCKGKRKQEGGYIWKYAS